VDVVVAEAGQDGAAVTVVDGLAAAPRKSRGDLGDGPATDAQIGLEPPAGLSPATVGWVTVGPANLGITQQEAEGWVGRGHGG
jgi:hypothetical protein